MIRVVLDDQQLVRTGLRMVLDRQPDMTVVGEAGDGAEALRLLRGTEADVVVMDLRMPVLDGVAATREICAAGPEPRVLVLITFDTPARRRSPRCRPEHAASCSRACHRTIC
ncbi:hypothetical protein Acsp02_90510 [Actinoplanes sp. NBRC 103695]|nr:hypothetical protein Acsp02_90510 [Actinoplanes sp. NBRC 103695]